MPATSRSTERESSRDPLLPSTTIRRSAQFSARNEEGLSESTYHRTFKFCAPFILPTTARLRVLCIFCIFCIVGAKAFHLVEGLFIKISVDALSSDDKSYQVRGPIIGAVIFLAGRFAVAVFTQGYEISLEYYCQQMACRFALYGFKQVLELPVSFHTGMKTGETTSILRRGIQSLFVLMRHLVFFLIPTLIEALYVTIIFFSIGSPGVAVSTFITVVLHIAYNSVITNSRVLLAREVRDAQNDVWSHATERLIHHSTVKSLGMDHEEVIQHTFLREKLQQRAFATKQRISFFDISSDFILQLGTFAGFIIAGIDAGSGRLSVGEFTLAITYIRALFYPLLTMSQSYGEVVKAFTNIEQVMELMEITSDIQDVDDAIDLRLKTALQCDVAALPEIEFRNVTFLYDAVDGEMSGGVRNLSFAVRPGETVGIVGLSGAGKSTIIRLLLRLYDVQEGGIFIDGVDIRYISQKSLRHTIGLVAQDTSLFNDTLRYNICYAKPGANEAELWHAVEMASMSKFVKTHREGLETTVGEQGLRLSGGERQRVGIARAIIKQPPIMMLDEATSALSSIDEREIQGNLLSLCRSTTTVVVAHRLSTVMTSDQIIVLLEGRIVENGSHRDLIALDGVYADMWNAQSGSE